MHHCIYVCEERGVIKTFRFLVAGHAADKLISQYRWPILKVRRLMTGIGLLGPGCLMLWLANITNLKLAVL